MGDTNYLLSGMILQVLKEYRFLLKKKTLHTNPENLQFPIYILFETQGSSRVSFVTLIFLGERLGAL